VFLWLKLLVSFFVPYSEKMLANNNMNKERIDWEKLSPREIKAEFAKINRKFVERYELIDDSDQFYSYLAKPIRTSIRINTLKIDPGCVLRRLKDKIDKEIPWFEFGFFVKDKEIGKTIEHKLGLIFLQEAASMIPPVVLDPKPGSKVLDIAAAPGAKTTQIAQLMQNDGCIIANDVKVDRVNILISNLQKCGVLIAKVTLKDGRFFGRFENKFDYVLIDAPCSNVGMIRKNFKYLKIWSMRDVKALSRLQKELLLAGYKSLRPGGTLVYSTCTLDPLENEEVVNFLLEKTNAELEEIDIKVKSRRPFTKFEGKEYFKEIKKCLRIHPQDNDTEGFFIAKIVKNY